MASSCYGRIVYGAALVSALALASCSNYSTQPVASSTSPGAVTPMKGNPNTQPFSISAAGSSVKSAGNDFNGKLAQEYYSYASARSETKDWVDSDYFARKSIAASKGDVVLPEDNKNRLIPMQPSLNTRGEMDDGRARLLAALDGGGRQKYPALAARTQALYDCWVERTEANYVTEFNGKCHQEFLASLNELESQLHPQATAQASYGQVFRVYFDLNSAELKTQAMKSLQEAAAALPKNGTSRIVVVGKADTSGNPAANMKLSEARAKAVGDGLAREGVPPSRMDVKGVGETQLEVATADGVREPRNRVVEVTVTAEETSAK